MIIEVANWYKSQKDLNVMIKVAKWCTNQNDSNIINNTEIEKVI